MTVPPTLDGFLNGLAIASQPGPSASLFPLSDAKLFDAFAVPPENGRTRTA
jgi:hypothetical protein